MDMWWIGDDGVRWDLGENNSGVYLLSGTRGLGMPTGTRFRDQSPASHGSQHRGHVWDEREVFWPIKTWHEDKGQSWVDRDRAFFSTLSPDKTGRWYVAQPGGVTRYLELRYDPKTVDEGWDIVPSIWGWASYALYLTADQPFWVGEPSVLSWEAARPDDPFYEPTGPHLFNFGQGFTVGNAAIDNRGEVPSPPRWFIDGEVLAGSSVGVGDKIVAVPFAVPAGKCLIIESDPTRIGATMYDVVGSVEKPWERIIGVEMINPVNMTRQLGEADFAAVPPGKSVPLSIVLQGTGMVACYLPSLYRRAT